MKKGKERIKDVVCECCYEKLLGLVAPTMRANWSNSKSQLVGIFIKTKTGRQLEKHFYCEAIKASPYEPCINCMFWTRRNGDSYEGCADEIQDFCYEPCNQLYRQFRWEESIREAVGESFNDFVSGDVFEGFMERLLSNNIIKRLKKEIKDDQANT